MELGKLRIEYSQYNNVIKIYNSIDCCSLVINDTVADEYKGLVATRFILKGTVTQGDKEIQIEVKMGFFNMRLYYDGVLVAKKFMAFG